MEQPETIGGGRAPRASDRVRRQDLGLDLIFFMALALLGWAFTSGIEHFLDIGLWDEGNYLLCGISIPTWGLPGAPTSPLYAAWYYVLSIFKPDTVALYYLNYQLVTVGLALTFFVWLRVKQVSRTLSYCFSIGILIAHNNFFTAPKASHLTVIVLLVGFIVASVLDNYLRAVAATCVFALLASLLRPEFFLSYLLLGGFLAFHSTKAILKARSPRPGIPFACVAIAGVVMVASLGSPWSVTRSWGAFGQHYAYNWVNFHNDPRNPWTNWEAIVKSEFGNVSSPIGAIAANPRGVAHHVLHNIREVPEFLGELVWPSCIRNRPAGIVVILALGLALITGLLLMDRDSFARWWSRVRENARELHTVGLLLVATLVPSAISIALIFPEIHYLIVIFTLAGAACLVLLFRNADHSERLGFPSLAALLLIPAMTLQPLATSWQANPEPNLRTVQAVRSLGIIGEVQMLEAEGGLATYVGRNFHFVAEYEKNEPFNEFVKRRSINMIIVSTALRESTQLAKDPEWISFIEDPSRHGFTSLEIPGVPDRRILVRSDVLEAARLARESSR